MREKCKSLDTKRKNWSEHFFCPLASIEQYRGNVDLSGVYWILGNHHKYDRPIERECRVVQRSLEAGDSEPKEGDSRRQLAPFQ
jgi:hypothetical protein